mmetsp:Transcript_21118/g.49576  ORF Transcript_21118/g.49576 Transcript_21118/m.49576 type:complete len:420 (+) Transcript_21118:165-1424(+)
MFPIFVLRARFAVARRRRSGGLRSRLERPHNLAPLVVVHVVVVLELGSEIRRVRGVRHAVAIVVADLLHLVVVAVVDLLVHVLEHLVDRDVGDFVVVATAFVQVLESGQLDWLVKHLLEIEKAYLDCVGVEEDALEWVLFVRSGGEQLVDLEDEAEPLLGKGLAARLGAGDKLSRRGEGGGAKRGPGDRVITVRLSELVDLVELLHELCLGQFEEGVEDEFVDRHVLAADGGERERQSGEVLLVVVVAPILDLREGLCEKHHPPEDHIRRGTLIVAEEVLVDGVVALDADLVARPLDHSLVVGMKRRGVCRGGGGRVEQHVKQLLVVRVSLAGVGEAPFVNDTNKILQYWHALALGAGYHAPGVHPGIVRRTIPAHPISRHVGWDGRCSQIGRLRSRMNARNRFAYHLTTRAGHPPRRV